MLRRSLFLSHTLLKAHLQSINPALIAKLEKYKRSDLPKLAFAAIDHNLLPKADFIKQILLRESNPCYLPIISECALGTYLATNHYRGNTSLIRRDCLALIDICDEFFIFTDSPFTIDSKVAINQLNEGVLFELAYWFTKNPGATVQIINIANSQLEIITVNNNDMNFIDNKNLKYEIESELEKQLKQRHKTLYLACASKHVKFVDWFRLDAFKHAQVPVNAHALVSTSNLIAALGDDVSKHLLYRAALARKCDRICFYSPMQRNKLLQADLDLDVLLEMFLVLHFTKIPRYLPIFYENFYNLNIPTYKKPSIGSITAKEVSEATQEKSDSNNSKQKCRLFNLNKSKHSQQKSDRSLKARL